ncbi:MAG: hypothetical protein U0X75_26070 [Acidobacteriota bacterium]
MLLTKTELRQVGKRALLTCGLLLLLLLIGLLINAGAAKRGEGGFAQAQDFPRGALVYAQFQDLPALLKQWDESSLKERYLASTNFQQLQTRHLAMKLVSRWSEFNDAAGFPLDVAALAGLADNRAALAVYDIGRLDLVLIAPLDDAKLAVSRVWQSKGNFEERTLPGDLVYYLADVEADRGRQTQQLGFASVNGRFVLATNEKLLLRTLANLQGAAKKDRLSDEPAFQALSKTVTPHFVTVWVEQAKLNDDWYFKRYWVMQNAAELKHLRAGMFDLEWQENRWTERREFLLDGKASATPGRLTKPALAQLARMTPGDLPYVQFRSVLGQTDVASALVGESLFGDKPEAPAPTRDWNWRRYDASDFAVSANDDEFYGASRYSYLSHRFNLLIDDPDDARESRGGERGDGALRLATEQKAATALRAVLQAAQPMAAAKLAQPRALTEPLFAEFNRATILTLQQPAALNRQALERALADWAGSRLLVAGAPTQLVWQDKAGQGSQWRELPLPMLGRALGYGVRGQQLVLANHPELLARLLTGERQAGDDVQLPTTASELTVVRLSQREAAFDRIFAQLDAARIKAYWRQRRGERESEQGSAPGPSQEFFSGEISSLLDVAAPVREIRVARNYANGRLQEEVSLILK